MYTIKEDWNITAQAYDAFNCAPDSYSYSIEWPAIQKMLPVLKGRKVLDIGCGSGIFTFLLEEYEPEEIAGLDLSEGMLEIAKQKAVRKGSKASFVLGDAASAQECVNETFDLIFSSTTSHYLKDLDGFFKSMEKVLRADGEIILSVIHPVYSAMYPISRGESFPNDEDWRVRYLDRSVRAYVQPWIEYSEKYEDRLSRSFHHTFGDYMNAIVRAGLKVCCVEEPLPPEAWKTDCEGRYESYMETPVYLIMKLKKS